ncbi:MAG: membrane protein insertase YidC, partial [Gammaproteobacteria bacterium]
MDKIRFALWFGLLAAIWVSYTTWVTENQPEPAPAATTANAAGEPEDDSLPSVNNDDSDLPAASVSVDGETVPAPATEAAAAPSRSIRVRTDVLDLIIDLDGGDIVRADLLEYPVHKSDPDTLVRLLDYEPDTRWVFQTGMLSGRDGQASPDHQQAFRADQDVYQLAADADELVVPLEWTGSGAGLQASKVYRFRRGQYGIELELVLDNETAEPWQGYAYAQMRRVHNPVQRKYMNVDTYSFTGPVL